jgi:hypothetical protein
VRVTQLDVVIYESHWKWRAEPIDRPEWRDVEGAIRALDRFHRPFVHLFLDQPLLEYDYMSVIGGSGAYWVGATVASQDILCLLGNPGGSEIVELWTSDQGFQASARHVVELDTALKAARYFLEHGTYDPSLAWEPHSAE